jgi:hypothetical protein
MENIPKDEELGKDLNCLNELVANRGYIPESISLLWMDNKFKYQCRGCKLKKALGFCLILDELKEIREKAAEVQEHTTYRESAPYFSQLRQYSTNPVSEVTNPMRTGRKIEYF